MSKCRMMLQEHWVARQARARQLESILAHIRKVAQEGTADDEVKLTRLADAIERGAHE